MAHLLNVAGNDANDMFESFTFDDEADKDNIDVVIEKFEERCLPAVNVSYERFCFFRRNQDSSENIGKYITEICRMAERCNFGGIKDSLTKDRIIAGMKHDDVRKKLLETPEKTLDQAIEFINTRLVQQRQAQDVILTGNRVSEGSEAQAKGQTGAEGSQSAIQRGIEA